MPSVSLSLIFVLFLWLGYQVVLALWNAYFGNLSKIPGPKLAAITRLCLIRHKTRGDAETWRFNLHRIYGDVVRVAPNEVSIANGSAWKDIYGFTPGIKSSSCEKDPAFYSRNRSDAETYLAVAREADHRRQRKAFSHAFSDKALREQEPLIQTYVSQLIASILQTTQSTSDHVEKVDMVKQYNLTAFDIMSDLAFGESLVGTDRAKFMSWMTSLFASSKLMVITTELNHYPIIKRLIRLMIPRSSKKRQELYQFGVDRVNKRLASDHSRPDIWSFVLREKHKLTEGEMHANATMFMTAGTETTATLLSALTYFLLVNPDKMRNLTQIIRERFLAADEIRVQDLLQLPYLSACIQEALRMHPPVPIGLPRIVHNGGIEVCGYQIPEGTSVYVHQLSTYLNPKNFVRPNEFLPERWLVDREKNKSEATSHITPQRASDDKSELDSSQFANDDRSCLQPFSIGPRGCIGTNLALLEIRLIITNVLWHFDLELCDESRGWDKQRIFTFWEAKPLMVTAKSVAR